jgi:hypothetical protein
MATQLLSHGCSPSSVEAPRKAMCGYQSLLLAHHFQARI